MRLGAHVRWKMRKRVSLILVLILSAVLLATLVACNGSQNIGKLPDEINPDKVIGGEENNTNFDTYLKFYFPKGVTSIFNAMFCDEFDASEVEYSVVYTNESITREVAGGHLTDAMITKVTDGSVDDKTGELKNLLDVWGGTPISWKAGHFMVHATANLDNGKTVSGSFALHLKDRYTPAPTVSLTFDLRDGEKVAQASFGKTNADGTKAIVTVESGVSFATWDDFTNAFRMNLKGKALDKVTALGKELSRTKGFPFTIDQSFDGKTFATTWTENVIDVQFTLDVPSDATVILGLEDPRPNFVEHQSVERNFGRVKAPVVDTFNVFNGYYFAGWYKDVNGNGKWDNGDTLWSFSQIVGEDDIKLVARWTKRSYTFTLYTMGGTFANSVKNSVVTVGGKQVEIDSDEAAAKAGLTVVSATTRFGVEDRKLNRITFSGLAYGHNFSEYVAKIEVEARQNDSTPAKSVYLTLDEVRANLVKGSADYVVDGGTFRDYQCTVPANMNTVIADEHGFVDDVAYIKWMFNDTDDAQLKLERLSGYYVNVVFKDGISIKADGSVRIDKIADDSLNEIIIPAALKIDGVVRPVSEIGAKACMNLKALSKVDLSAASNLTTIGEQAFAHCTNLATILAPVNDNVTAVGKNVFYRTHFENNYTTIYGGKELIVMGKVVYKYVGDPSKKALDLSKEEYYNSDNCTAGAENITKFNLQIRNATTIATGAFENCTALETITFGDNIKTINDGAFENVATLDNIVVSATSKLQVIAADAFRGCEHFLGTESKAYNDTYKAIVIGKVFYRFIDQTATTATISGSATPFIAADAFRGRGNVENVSIMFKDKILFVGANAFYNTTWIQIDGSECVNDGFTVVNGILCEYFVDKYDASKVNLIIPSDVTTIGGWSFNTYAQYIKTVQIKANVNAIEDYAFAGATSLRSVIFTESAVSGGKIVGLPAISSSAFANKSGQLIDGVRFFFKPEVMNFFEDMASGTVTSEDTVTNQWYTFYKLNKANFITEEISNVWINQDIIADKLLRTAASEDVLKLTYGDTIAQALVVLGNTGVERKETLDLVKNSVELKKVVEGDKSFGYLYEQGKEKYVVTFKYDGKVDGCEINPHDQHLFVITVANAIDDASIAKTFYTSNVDKYDSNETVIDALGKNADNSAFWFEGFDGQVKGAEYPTFYTSNSGVDVFFCYRDVTGEVQKIKIEQNKITGFNTVTTKLEGEAVFTVNFYDVGVYKFKIKYAVQESKFVAIEQNGAVSIPLNGNATTHFANFTINLVGQDGLKTEKELRTSNFDIIEVDGVLTNVVNTTKLGMHTLKIRYSKSDAAEPIVQTIVYSVILDADASIFEYDVVDEMAMTAKIVKCHAVTADTIVIPATVTIGGKTYTVTQIGETAAKVGVFENFTALKAVYLSTNVQSINARTFAGCSLLENVYTVKRIDTEKAALTQANFEILSTRNGVGEVINEVKVANLDGITVGADKVLAIGSQYVVEGEGGRVVHDVVQIADGLVLPEGVEQVFLPDTVYNLFTIYKKSATESLPHGDAIEPIIYASAADIMLTTTPYVSDSVTYIGASAFENCISLDTIDLTHAVNLAYIGSNAFAGSGLNSIDLSGNTKLEDLNSSVFEGCLSLASVKVASTLKKIGANCFKNNKELASFIFSDANGLKEIGADAFYGCAKLTSVPTVA